MKITLKVFLASIIISLPFWWTMNILGANVEGFFLAQITESIPDQALIVNEKENRIEIEDPEINAKSVISLKINKNGGEEILFEKNSDQKLPIASLSKLATALIVFKYPEYYDLSEPITISSHAVGQQELFGDLNVGERMSVEDLLYIMLMESSNDAAYSLGEVLGKKAGLLPGERIGPFIALMNLETEKNIGLENSEFINLTGLDTMDPNSPVNSSTTKDLAKLSAFIIKEYPQIFEISSNFSHEILGEKGEIHHLAINTNKLLDPSSEICANDENCQLMVKNIVGSKTGYTKRAGGCMLLVLKNKKGEYFINIILGAEDSNARFYEMKKIMEWLKQAGQIS